MELILAWDGVRRGLDALHWADSVNDPNLCGQHGYD